MLSPDIYQQFVLPHDARLLKEIGKGSIHFCGDGSHLIEKMLEIPDLCGLDLGQPHMMDIGTIYDLCREGKVAITHLLPSREDLVSGKARSDFPTGCVFVYYAEDYEDARQVVSDYQSV